MISFNNPNNENYTLKVYDFLGNEVKQIYNITSNRVILNSDGISIGAYFIELRCGDKSYLSKILIE